MKKIILQILTGCGILFAAVPTVFAQFSGGNGTESNPYIITTSSQLAQLATYVNNGNTAYNDKHYKLGNDLDLSEYQTQGGWKPIGWYSYSSDSYPFKGTFDGNKKVVSKLMINDESGRNSGLFGYVLNSTIKNLGISIEEGYYSYGTQGGIIGYNDGGAVLNCYSIGFVGACYDAGTAGGIVGYNKNGTVSNCYSTAKVRAAAYGGSGKAGGIVGVNDGGTITNCYSTGEIYSSSDHPMGGTTDAYAGGIVGNNIEGSISNCVALNSKLTCSPDGGTSYFGRIAGQNTGTLTNNAAFNNMINPNGGTTWSNVGASNISGENMTVQTINTDGTLGGRFTNANGWTTQTGKLPGLFGKLVNMPEHLRLPGAPHITTTNLPDGTVGNAYNQTLAANGDAPITWSLESGSLPNGLAFTSAGVILGVPLNSGIYRFTIKATNAVAFDTKDFVIYVFNLGCPLIITESLPNGAIGEVYQYTLSVISDLPVTWSLESGNLPDGLTLSSDGIILGVPTTNGVYAFTVTATNALGLDTKQLKIDIGNVGISENYAASVKVFPNPTSNKFIVEIDGTVTVKLYDIFGREVLSQIAIDKTEININHLQKGSYIISVLADGKVVGNGKIVKQ